MDHPHPAPGIPPAGAPEAMETIRRSLVVPVVVVEDAAVAADLAAVLVAGGLPAVEITLRTPVALDAVAAAVEVPGAVVGAGTVLSAAQVDAAVAAGASFVVSPGLDEGVVARCRHHGIPVLPGVATASDLMAALRLGLGTVKFFPAGPLGGPAMLAALAQPFPGLQFMPTGGVRPGTVADYLALPAVVAVGGTWIAPLDALRRQDMAEVAGLAAAARALAVAARPSSG